NFSLFLRRLRRSLGCGRNSNEGTRRRASRLAGRSRLGLEHLEDRLAPALLWVDNTPLGSSFTATGGTQPASQGGLTPGVDLFATIQDAVDAASPGDTINVSDGTYSELVTVNKALTLQGNQFGADARTRGAVPETIVDGALNGSERTTAF